MESTCCPWTRPPSGRDGPASTGAERAGHPRAGTPLAQADQARIRTAREVAAIAEAATADPDLRLVGNFAAYAGGACGRSMAVLSADLTGLDRCAGCA